MKKLFLILLIALTTCEIFEENFDDNAVLDKKKKSITSPVKTKKKIIETKNSTKITTGPTTGTTRVKISKPSMKEISKIKGVNGTFKGKLGEIFRKLKEVVKKGIAWLKEKGLLKELVKKIRIYGEAYGNEYCQKIFPSEVCGPAVDFLLNSVLGKPEEEQA